MNKKAVHVSLHQCHHAEKRHQLIGVGIIPVDLK